MRRASPEVTRCFPVDADVCPLLSRRLEEAATNVARQVVSFPGSRDLKLAGQANASGDHGRKFIGRQRFLQTLDTRKMIGNGGLPR